MIGFLFVAAVLVAVAMIGFTVLPSYIEYYAVEKALKESVTRAKEFNSPKEVRDAFQRHADAGYIESVQGKDIEVTKRGNDIVASAAWTRRLHLVGNVSLLLDFEASATR
jgi:uncharacterized protein DUF4845